MSDINKSESKKKNYFFIERPKFAMVISIFITLVGMLALAGLKLEKYPDITPPQIQVVAMYPGANASLVEETVASIIEAQVNGVEDMIYMTSTSSNERYSLTVFFKVGSNRNMNLVNVQNRIQQITALLPTDVTRIGITAKQAVTGAGVLMVAVQSPDESVNQLDLYNYASIYIKDEIARLPGVGEVNVYGAGDYSIRIWLDPMKMKTHYVSVSEIKNAISTQNIQSSAGALGEEPLVDKQVSQITLRTKGTLKKVEDYENIVVRSNSDGSKILLKDVARIEMGAKAYNQLSTVDGKAVAMIQVIQIPGANVVEIAKAVKAKLEQLKPGYPEGIDTQVFKDDTVFIIESMHEVVKTILETSFLVVLVILLFLADIRATVIPVIVIPVTLIGTFAALHTFGMTVNILTLFAMVLAVASVVDDAIVVIENVKRHLEAGESVIAATQKTMEEIGGALVAMALVLMAVFVPIAFVPGLSGVMYKQFAVTIAVSIGLSAICALSLSPAISITIMREQKHLNAKKLKEQNETIFTKAFALMTRGFEIFNEKFKKFSEGFLKYVKFLVYNKKLAVASYLLIIFITLYCFRTIPQGFIPTEDEDVLVAQIILPPGAAMSRTADYCDKVTKVTENIEGIEKRINIIGIGSTNSAFIIFQLLPIHERDMSGITGGVKKLVRFVQGKPTDLSYTAIANRIRGAISQYHDATAYVIAPPPISGMSMTGGFEFQLLSKGDYSPQELEKYATMLIGAANQDKMLSNVYTTYQSSTRQYIVNINEQKVLAQNVDLAEVYATFASLLGTYYVNDFNMLGRVFRVQLRADQEFRRDKNDISKFYVKSRNGEMVPIMTFTELEDANGAATITRYNQYRSILINGQPAKGRSTGDAMNAMEKVSKKVLPKDIGYEWSGTSAQEREASGQTTLIVAMALIFVYLFLVALYESWSIPFSVMLISPIAALGALVFQMMTGTAFDLYSQVGLIMLIGMSTKQAILIVEFAKDLHEKKGYSIEEAAIEATRLRLRAVFMTAIAFIIGMIPLVLATGAGAASRQSLGNTVFGGMIATCFLGTLMTPAFYTLIQTLVYKAEKKKIKN